MLNFFKSILLVLANIIMGISGIVLWIGGVAIHVWTIIIAYMSGGIISAVVTAIMPIISQIYWVFRSINLSGVILNKYSFTVFSYVFFLALVYTIMIIFGIIADKKEKNKQDEKIARQRNEILAVSQELLSGNVLQSIDENDQFENLKKLKEIFDLGIISESEYEDKKSKILNNL